MKSRLLPALGLDYGQKRIGVALAVSSLAEPLTILEQSPQLVTQVCQLINHYHIQTVVVGISEGESAARARQLITAIRRANRDIKIVEQDETLSSQEARARLRTAHRRPLPKERVDHYAAAIILEDWLDEQAANLRAEEWATPPDSPLETDNAPA